MRLGRPLPLGSVPHCVRRGVLFLSEDRAGEGIFHQRSVLENLLAGSLAAHAPWRLGLAAAQKRVELRLASASPSIAVGSAPLPGKLSGGNQQKLLFGRAIERPHPGVLLMNEPTRGIDVGARADIYRIMRELCSLGYA